MNNALTINGALSFGWAEVRKNPWFLVLLSVAFAAVSIIVGGAGDKNPSVIGQVLSFLISSFATFTFTRIGLAALAGRSFSWRDVFEVNWKAFGLFLVATIVSGIIYAVGFVLLVIPCVIAMVRLNLFGYALIGEGASPIDSLKRSWSLTRGYFWKLFGFFVVTALVVFAGILALGVGVFVAMPVITFAIAHVYGSLKASGPALFVPATEVSSS